MRGVITEPKKRRAADVVAGLACVFILALGSSCLIIRQGMAGEYRTFWSPDAKYRIVVYASPMLISSIGGAGDASGFVRLYDSRGRVLEEQEVEMVQLIDEVNWEKSRVEIKLFAEWELPQE